MAELKDVIYTIIKYAIMIITFICLVLLTVELVNNLNNKQTFTAANIIYYIIAYAILLFGFFGGWKEDFLYLIICGVSYICVIIFGFTAQIGGNSSNSTFVILTILVFIFAFLVRRGGASAISIA